MPTVKDPPRRFALYLESRPKAGNAQTNSTRQAIIIPSLRRASGVWTSPRIYSRMVSEFSSRSQWKKLEIARLPTSPRSTTESPSYMEAIEQQHLLTDEVQSPDYMSEVLANSHAKWILMTLSKMYDNPGLDHQTPLFVEVTDNDVVDIFSKKTPSALMRRIERVRTEAGLPATVWVPHSTTGITAGAVPVYASASASAPTPTPVGFTRSATGAFVPRSTATLPPSVIAAAAGSGKS